MRVTLLGLLDGARCPVQIDIGFSDAVTPGPEHVQYPVLLDEMPPPQLRVYTRYTVLAEKLEAIVSIGMLNSRMKDYFDLWILAQYTNFDGAILARAVHATFERRSTGIPADLPAGLSDAFALDEHKNRQWLAFLQKNALASMPLATVIDDLRQLLMPVLTTLATGGDFDSQRHAGTGWKTS